MTSCACREVYLKAVLQKHFTRMYFTNLYFDCSNSKVIATTDVDDGYLKESMLLYYAKATKETGKFRSSLLSGPFTNLAKGGGAHRERLKIISNAIALGKPFSDLKTSIKAALDTAFDEKRREILGDVVKLFDRISKDFDLSFLIEEIPDPGRDILRQEMKAFVLKSKAELDSHIMVELARAEVESDH